MSSSDNPVQSSSGAKDNTQTCQRYTKLLGAADMEGEMFEVKMLALIFLRLIGAGADAEFAIASNMAEAGKFDDIVVKSRKSPQDPWQTTMLQLKHKQNAHLTRSLLLSLEGTFSLVKYCDSFHELKCKELEFFGDVDGFRFIIFTDAILRDKDRAKSEAEVELNSGGQSSSTENVQRENYKPLADCECEADELFNTGGQCISLAGDDVEVKLIDLADLKAVLDDLKVQIDGKSDQEADGLIRDEMNSLRQSHSESLKSSKIQLSNSPCRPKLVKLLEKWTLVRDKEIYRKFLGKLTLYANQAREKDLDAFIKEKLREVWVSNDSDADTMFRALLDSIKDYWSLKGTADFLKPNSLLWLDLIKTQIKNLSRISSLEEFGIDFEESHLKSLWRKIPRSGVMIVSVDSLTTVTAIKVMRAFDRLGDGGNVLHVDLATLLEREDEVLAAWSSRWCDRLVIECSTDLDKQQVSQLTQKITNVVNSSESKLVLLVAKKTHCLYSELSNADCMVTKIIGKCEWDNLTKQSQEKVLSKCIDLQGAQISLSDLVDEKFLSEMHLELMSGLLQKDVRCGKSLEKAGGFFIARRLKRDGAIMNVNSVNDVPDPVVLVQAEPGMGKTTLMQQLARSAKEVDRCCWTLQIKLCDCTELLQAVSSEDLSPEQAWEFLGHFAFDTGHCLEKTLFKYWKHDVCVFVDGVDEVCPHYEKQVLALLICFKKLQLKHLWVASRPVCIPKLELGLEVERFELEEFSKEDQISCIREVWKIKSSGISVYNLNMNAEKMLKRLKLVIGEDNPILGVPLMTIMIAETFQSIETTSSSSNKIYDVLFVYKSFVRNKFDVYCSEKKRTVNSSLPAVVDEVESNWKMCLQKHKLAGLSVLFSRAEIAALNFNGKDKFDETLASFCKEIAEGRERTGIIDNIDAAGKPHFVHRTFAEFFATTWLIEHHAANPEFTKRIMFNAEFRLMSEMFNSFLTNGHPLHLAVTNRDQAAIEEQLHDNFFSPEILLKTVDEGIRTALHLAVFYSLTTVYPEYYAIVKHLLELKVRTDLPDRVLGWRPWQYAEHAEAWPLMGLLLANADVDEMAFIKANSQPAMNNLFTYLAQKSEAPPDASLLLSVASDAVVSVVRFLVEERGGDVFCNGPLGVTLMHRAAEGGNIDVMEYLAEKGVSLVTKNQENATPMHYAAMQGKYLAVGFIARRESAKNDCVIGTQMDHLYAISLASDSASASMSLEIVIYLLSIAAFGGDTPLHVACREGIAEVVSFLLQNGVVLEVVNGLGQTSLHLACQQGHIKVVETLIAYNCNVDARNNLGQTALLVASLENDLQVVKLLVTKGASMVGENNHFTPLHVAAQEGNVEVVAYLIEVVGDIDAVTNTGGTALYIASFNGRLDVVKLLVSKRASMKGALDGFTPLHAAAQEGKADVVAFLVGHVDDINVLTNTGETAHYLASHHGHLDVVRLLVEKGARTMCDLYEVIDPKGAF